MTLGQKTIKTLIYSLILLRFIAPVSGNNAVNDIILSKKAEITLLTSTPGEELYSIFGHSALRVNDPENNIDKAYNYGTFDFDTHNFYLNFARGRLMYKLSVAPYYYYKLEYRSEGRAIYEQVLNLNQQEKQRIFAFLQENALPENKYYHYDFLYDNCATRIRDIIDNLLEVEWYKEPYKVYDKTFRDLLSPYLNIIPWSKFGTDIILGLPTDKTATPYEYMFLPDNMFIAFAMARLEDDSPLVGKHRLLLEKSRPIPSPNPFMPAIICWLIFVLGIISFFNKKINIVFDMTFFSLLSLAGLIILFLWFGSEHLATNNNMNLLWALPTHIYFFAKYHFKMNNQTIVRWYLKLIMILSALLILLWTFLPQDLNKAFFPVILIIFIKSLSYTLNINLPVKLYSFFNKKE